MACQRPVVMRKIRRRTTEHTEYMEMKFNR